MNNTILKEEEFIKANALSWKELADRTSKFKRVRGKLSKKDIDSYIVLYNTVTNHLAYSRTYYGETETTSYLNKIVGAAHSVIYTEKRTPFKNVLEFFLRGFPILFRKHILAFVISTVLFVGGGIFAYCYTANDIQNAAAFVDINMISQIREEGNYDEMDVGYGMLTDANIATNNILVCIESFVFGFTLGIGTIWVLIYNGIMIGVLGAVYMLKGQSIFFWSLIVPHGVPELFAIFLSGACGLIIGYSIIDPKGKRRRDSFILAAKDAGLLLLGAIPILIFAAFVESFFTPLPIPYVVKYSFAAIELLATVAYFTIPGRKRKKKKIAEKEELTLLNKPDNGKI